MLATICKEALMRWLTFAMLCAAGVSNWAAQRPEKAIHHYVFFNRDREAIGEEAFINTAGFEGAQVKYMWRRLERKQGEYDFSEIEHDLAFLKSKGKKLFIQIQDSSFDDAIMPIPPYLREEGAYHGGADRQYEITGDDETHARPAGWVARRWDPAVRERFANLLAALGKQFDGRIEGINLPETAVDFGETGKLYPAGFTPTLYRDGVLANMEALRKAFPQSVTIQYANFMPGDGAGRKEGSFLRAVYRRATELHVGVGGPDLLPSRPWQRENSYPLIREVAGSVPCGIAVQEGNYGQKNPQTGKRITLEELEAFAREELRVDYIFWGREEPFYSKEVVPRVRRK
jgi:hypothetical protein